jgi:hypothetical protein
MHENYCSRDVAAVCSIITENASFKERIMATSTNKYRRTLFLVLGVIAVVVLSGVSAAALTGWTPSQTGFPADIARPVPK